MFAACVMMLLPILEKKTDTVALLCRNMKGS